MESEWVVGGIFALALDGIGALLDLTVAGAPIAAVLKTGAKFGIDEWVKRKGGTGTSAIGKQIATYLTNLIPLATLILFIVSVYSHNHPKPVGAIEKTSDIAKTGARLGLPTPIK